ncbi:MAG: 4Fe-4S binding protein [Candidatus Bathyarchaeota archaeon]|jgi:polyferredoxin
MTETETAASRSGGFLNIQILRMAVQFLSFLLFVAVVFGLGPFPVVLPVMFTLGLQQQALGDAFAMLQVMLSEAVFPWIPLASFFLVAALLGRSLCGWVCPFGLVQDVVGFFKKKHMEILPRTHSWMVNIKYVVLLGVLLVSGSVAAILASGSGEGLKSALGVFAVAPFNALSPADTLFAVIPNSVFNLINGVDSFVAGALAVRPLLWIRFVILGAVLVLAAYVPRSWCKYFCPHGAILAFLNRFSFLGLTRDPVKCTKAGCSDCVQACPMNVPILELPWEKFTHPECIYCLKCADACTTKAIKPKIP